MPPFAKLLPFNSNMLSPNWIVDAATFTIEELPKIVRLPAIVVEPLTYKFLPIPTPPLTINAPSFHVVVCVEFPMVVIPLTSTLPAVSNFIFSTPFTVSIVIYGLFPSLTLNALAVLSLTLISVAIKDVSIVPPLTIKLFVSDTFPSLKFAVPLTNTEA